MSQLRDLSLPFSSKYVHGNPSGGGQYVGHEVITQRLLMVCGPFSFEVAQVIRGHVSEIVADPKANSKRGKEGRPALIDCVVGIVGRLTVQVDGRQVSIEEAGDCEDPHNWPHDGARMKDACSDSIKRCAMRLGLGIHLWAQNEFFLFDELSKVSGTESGAPEGSNPSSLGSGESEPTAAVGTPMEEAASSQSFSPGVTPASSESVPSRQADTPGVSLSQDEQLEIEDLLARLKEWVGGNSGRNNILKAKASKAALDSGITPAESIGDAPLAVLRIVAGDVLSKEASV